MTEASEAATDSSEPAKPAAKKSAKKTTKKKAKRRKKIVPKKLAPSAEATDDSDGDAAEPVEPTEPDTASEQAEEASDTEDAADDAERSASEAESPDDDSDEAAEAKPTKKAKKKTKRSRKKSAETDAADSASEKSAEPAKAGKTRMVINYLPGEECRIAIVEDNKLEEFHAEQMDAISRVNNIYVGRVTNVETGIQAAFVDFGLPEAGFLHVSDLHPRYFPGADADEAERVGKKTPRRERPPIQQALKRGQEVVVQVLKEGVGTKGPTLTSYLSIPGRFLVMMPQMDKVGVSRKVDDEDTRKKMRAILDQLDLPEGFGFILRTAGFDRTKTELKRDLAYLQRLWKDIDRRLKRGKKPRLLYSESDLLVRALRDQVSADIDEVVIDDERALERASTFLKIVAPRRSTNLVRYTGGRPIFHAFGLEEQLALMHAREVPLPSGGRLVIDETEAVIAIDVNSGRMRSTGDSESNAVKTNTEAVDEICRQMRLRDIGGIVINDLIDMRQSKNRKAIENRFKERLKRDRAKSTVAPISMFGILEMTRQRMRGSLRSQTFAECPACSGRGMVKRPSAVAAEALRDLAAILDNDRVSRVELVVSPRVAGELLSKKRRSLNRIEHRTGKHADVRVSENLGFDRISVYAYDANGADIDLERLPKPKNLESIDRDSIEAEVLAHAHVGVFAGAVF
ncbi:MAG: Rne/Rng family ribonuclease, partial [Planctomycetota bacterium]